MKILITGATGFLGTHLSERLIRAGHRVRSFARSKPAQPALREIELFQGDLQDRSAVRGALQGVQAIYHLAGLVSFRPEDGRRMYQLHVDGTRGLLEEVHQMGDRPRFILASTSGTIAVSKERRVAREDAPYPIEVIGRWPYYLSKVYEEKLALEFCKRHQIPLVVMNPSLLLGPGDRRLSSTWTVSKFLAQEIPVVPNGGVSFVDVRDAADAFVQALNRGELYGRHLLGVNLTLKEFFERLSRLSGVPMPRLALPSTLNVLGGHLLQKWSALRGQEPALHPQEVEIGEHFFWLDAQKAERELSFRARDIQETLFDTVQFLVNQMPPSALPGTKGRMALLRQRA